MAAPQLLHRSPAVNHRQTVLLEEPRHGTFGEYAGGATADFAAVACCIPLAMVELAVLAVYKVPAGLAKKALKKNKRHNKRRRGLAVMEYQLGLAAALDDSASDMVVLRNDVAVADDGSDRGDVDMDNDMWQDFYAPGFWRGSEDNERHDEI